MRRRNCYILPTIRIGIWICRARSTIYRSFRRRRSGKFSAVMRSDCSISNRLCRLTNWPNKPSSISCLLKAGLEKLAPVFRNSRCCRWWPPVQGRLLIGKGQLDHFGIVERASEESYSDGQIVSGKACRHHDGRDKHQESV